MHRRHHTAYGTQPAERSTRCRSPPPIEASRRSCSGLPLCLSTPHTEGGKAGSAMPPRLLLSASEDGRPAHVVRVLFCRAVDCLCRHVCVSEVHTCDGRDTCVLNFIEG